MMLPAQCPMHADSNTRDLEVEVAACLGMLQQFNPPLADISRRS